jgi:hypothetical protein
MDKIKYFRLINGIQGKGKDAFADLQKLRSSP